MTFELTDSLISDILSALDNQEEKFLVDAKTGALVKVDENTGAVRDSEQYYELPEWTSANGFKLREDFVNALYSPIAKEELQNVLHSGRGVFRNFRLILKDYPEVEKRWHLYKNRIMTGYINQWYNDLREIWGLEKLDYLPESDETLIHDDFTFSEYSSDEHKQEILSQVSASFRENKQNIPEELISILYDMWHQQFERADTNNQMGFVCNSLSEDFAGFITASPVTTNQEKVVTLTGLFVPETFRGLGIGTELFSLCLSELKRRGVKWILLPDTILPETLQPLLSRSGFEKIGSGYAARLQ
ncbi:MAG: GNAT family N-acetyltransferase [Treponema sp.]|nr:GNAT family N-acetyltransferase [Treponema sp.]